jgi:hypothetical protein
MVGSAPNFNQVHLSSEDILQNACMGFFTKRRGEYRPLHSAIDKVLCSHNRWQLCSSDKSNVKVL